MSSSLPPCPRCQGLRVATQFGTGEWWAFEGWLCLNCGDVTDPVILTNRGQRTEGARVSMAAKGMRTPGGAVSSGRVHRLT